MRKSLKTIAAASALILGLTTASVLSAQEVLGGATGGAPGGPMGGPGAMMGGPGGMMGGGNAGGMMGSGMMGSGMMGPGMMGPGMMNPEGMPVTSPCLEMMGTATGMMGPGAGAPMGMFGLESADQVEGRIAFLRAELGITEDQATAWEAFADTLRSSATASQELRRQVALAAPQASLAERLEQQAAWLALRADNMRSLKESFARLSTVLSDEQRKTAEWLLTPHFGRMPMGMI